MPAPEVVMFIRHGEKPADDGPPHGVNEHGEHDPHALAVRGWTRAGALATLFGHAPLATHPYIVRPGRILPALAGESGPAGPGGRGGGRGGSGARLLK